MIIIMLFVKEKKMQNFIDLNPFWNEDFDWFSSVALLNIYRVLFIKTGCDLICILYCLLEVVQW